jgi:hypothetical protein
LREPRFFTCFLRTYDNSLLEPVKNANMKNHEHQSIGECRATTRTFMKFMLSEIPRRGGVVVVGHRLILRAIKSILAAVATAATAFCLQAQPAPSAEATNSDYTVTLHYEKDVPVSKTVAQKLQSDVVEMMKTANWNSRTGWGRESRPHVGQQESVSEITRHYRKLVASGKYVLIVWAHPKKVQTVSGEVTTCETILELEKPGVWMCNLDDEARLVRFGKFSGPMLVKLEEFVRQLVK